MSDPLNVALLCTEEPRDRLARQVLYCLADINARVFLVGDKTVGHSKYKYSRFVQDYSIAPFPTDIEDTTEFTEWLRNYIRANEIDVICGSDIFTTKLASSLSQTFEETRSFPVADVETIALLDNKWEFFQLLQRLQLPAPPTLLIEDWTPEARRRVSAMPFPVMTKPLQLSGGRGILPFDNVEDLDEYLRAPGPFNQMPLLIQQYAGDTDIGLGFMASHGRIVAAGVQIHETIEQAGPLIRFIDHAEVLRIGELLVAETNYTGPAFIDMRLAADTGQIYVLEFNPRVWFTIAVAMLQGRNFVSDGIRLIYDQSLPDRSVSPSGTYYPRISLRSRRFLRLLRRKTEHKGSLRGVWLERSDPLVRLHRRLNR